MSAQVGALKTFQTVSSGNTVNRGEKEEPGWAFRRRGEILPARSI